MITISLREFTLTGNFGPIKMGMSRNEIVDLLGQPEAENDYGESCGLNYGWYEFFYWGESLKLYGVQNDHLEADCDNHNEMILFENEKFKIDIWFLSVGKDITYKEVKDILNKEKLEYIEEVPYKNGPDTLKFKSGVYFDFSGGKIGWSGDDDNPENWKQFETTIENLDDHTLNGIRHFVL
jgi:hypothetical protein